MFSIVKKISRQTICVMIMNDSSISKRPRHCYHRRQFLVGGDDYWNSPPDFQTDPTSATGVQYKHRTCKMAMMMIMMMMILLIMILVIMGYAHTWFFSILAHHLIIWACKSTPKSAQIRDKLAQMSQICQNFAFKYTSLKKVHHRR